MKKSNLEQEFNIFINSQLIESCQLMYDIANKECSGGVLDEKSCGWYHSAWQYLRILDKVSSPTWHFNFYYKSFFDYLSNESKVLITGTADYTLLALLYFVATKKNVKPQIWVCDICRSPLLICQHFANVNKFSLSVIQENILTFDINETFDIITTDAFLSRFYLTQKKKIISKWNSLLSNQGKIITTIKVDENIALDEESKVIDKKDSYVRDVEILVAKSELKNQINRILNLAETYITKIVSIPFSGQKEIENVFSEHGFRIHFWETVVVKGEAQPTKYIRVVAEK